MNTYRFDLNYDEVRLLDAKCSTANQVIIDKIMKEKSHSHELALFGMVIETSLVTGEFKVTHKPIRWCPVCSKHGGYYVYDRTSRYHRKGEKNHSKPKYLSGIAFNEGFITFQGSGDICVECSDKHNLVDSLVAYIFDNDLPIEIVNQKWQTRYKKDDMRVCYQCKQEMYESEMRKLPALMGGYYPGECPKCKAQSLPFGQSHWVSTKFRMVRVEVNSGQGD